MTNLTPRPATDASRLERNRGNQLRRRADRLGFEARQVQGAWRLLAMAGGDRQPVFSGDIDAAEAYLAGARPRRPFC